MNKNFRTQILSCYKPIKVKREQYIQRHLCKNGKVLLNPYHNWVEEKREKITSYYKLNIDKILSIGIGFANLFFCCCLLKCCYSYLYYNHEKFLSFKFCDLKHIIISKDNKTLTLPFEELKNILFVKEEDVSIETENKRERFLI